MNGYRGMLPPNGYGLSQEPRMNDFNERQSLWQFPTLAEMQTPAVQTQEAYDPFHPSMYSVSASANYTIPPNQKHRNIESNPAQNCRTFVAPVHRSSVYDVEGLNCVPDEYVPEIPLPPKPYAYTALMKRPMHHSSNTGQRPSVNSSDMKEYPVLRDSEFQGYREDLTYNKSSQRFETPYQSEYASPYHSHEGPGPNHSSPADKGVLRKSRQPSIEIPYSYGSSYNQSNSNSNASFDTRCSSKTEPVSRRNSSVHCESGQNHSAAEPVLRNTPTRSNNYSSNSNTRYYHVPRQESDPIQNPRQGSPEISIIKEQGVFRKRLWNSNTRNDWEERGSYAPEWKKSDKPHNSPAALKDDTSAPGVLKTPEKLYHYTSEDGAFGILKDKHIGMKEGTKRFGVGVYFTDLPPQTSSGEIAFSNYRSRTEEKLLRTEYCFEILSKNIPSLELCQEEERRPFWKAGVHQVFLERNWTYYCRKLRGPEVPLAVEPFTVDF